MARKQNSLGRWYHKQLARIPDPPKPKRLRIVKNGIRIVSAQIRKAQDILLGEKIDFHGGHYPDLSRPTADNVSVGKPIPRVTVLEVMPTKLNEKRKTEGKPPLAVVHRYPWRNEYHTSKATGLGEYVTIGWPRQGRRATGKAVRMLDTIGPGIRLPQGAKRRD